MADYRRVYDSHHLRADYQEPGSAPEPYARYIEYGLMGYLYLYLLPRTFTLPRNSAPIHS